MEQFFTSLFDFSFRKFITPSIIRILYMLCIAVSGLTAVGMILSGFRAGIVSGIVSLVLAPLIFVVTVCFYRVGLEVILNLFRIANYAAEIARSTRKPQSDQRGKTASPDPDFNDTLDGI